MCHFKESPYQAWILFLVLLVGMSPNSCSVFSPRSGGELRSAVAACKKLLRKPLFRFGLITDVQYADIDNGPNFARTETRNYRESLAHLKGAVALWNSVGVDFAASLGDLLDGQNSGTYGQGLNFKVPQTHTAFSKVWHPLTQSRAPVYHAIGNHELYNFDSDMLKPQFNEDGGAQVVSASNIPLTMRVPSPAAADEFYFSFRPFPGWTFVMLNPYEVSVMQDKSSEGYKRAAELLNTHNPNDVLGKDKKANYFKDLSGLEQRWVPYNGALGLRQSQWLRRALGEAKRRGDHVVILSHIPVYPEAASPDCITFDYDETLRIISDAGCVVAFIAGHYHTGGYAVDPSGTHHITLQSPLTHGASFGHVDVHADRLDLVGVGALPSRTILVPSKD